MNVFCYRSCFNQYFQEIFRNICLSINLRSRDDLFGITRFYLLLNRFVNFIYINKQIQNTVIYEYSENIRQSRLKYYANAKNLVPISIFV